MAAKKKKGSAQSAQSSANSMWGGHFTRGPAEAMARINECLDADKRLYAEDIAASKAHAAMLAARGIISRKDAEDIRRGLDAIQREIESGKFVFSAELEDIHMNVESRLAALIGDAAGRLHTGRSRNDQVAVDLRLWTRNAVDAADAGLLALQKALVAQAEIHSATLMPGFTHLQTAQPVTFGHHLLAYVEMFARDRGRFADARARMNESPLGAAALAGTSFPIDRAMTARELGFDRPMANSMDAVSDRDFALEFLSAASITGIHLSRLAEEIIIWMSAGFRFVALSEAFTTGSSIMPQKRNPDAAELIRAKAAALAGAFTHMAMLVKGLPLAYNKDLQDTKPPLMRAADELMMSLEAMAGMVADMRAIPDNMREAAGEGFITATDLADWLVRALGMPFRQAHHTVGKLVKIAEGKGCRLEDLSLAEMRGVERGISAEVYACLKPEKAISSRRSIGGTAPDLVLAQARKWKKRL